MGVGGGLHCVLRAVGACPPCIRLCSCAAVGACQTLVVFAVQLSTFEWHSSLPGTTLPLCRLAEHIKRAMGWPFHGAHMRIENDASVWNGADGEERVLQVGKGGGAEAPDGGTQLEGCALWTAAALLLNRALSPCRRTAAASRLAGMPGCL